MPIRLLRLRLFVAVGFLLATAASARAQQDRLCDPGAEDCREILLTYIRNETVAIDVGFWFMEDARYTTELIRRYNAGVPVRVLIDPRANSSYPLNAQRLQELQTAGIPMRKRLTSYILHWKMMLFHGQNVVQFSGANYSPNAWVPLSAVPYANYIDEAIYFTGDTAIVNSFRTKFDDQWVDTTNWADYANISGVPGRRYDISAIDPTLNFPPAENYRTRSIGLYKAETQKIDAIMYRITDRQHTDNILAAVARGVPVRLITEPAQYRDPARLWHAWNVDRLFMGGVRIRHRAHAGLTHQKSVILHGLSTVIFGSSNWTSPSAAGQLEHNIFTRKSDILSWFVSQFERKWSNSSGVAESTDFVPLPPDAPATPAPANQTTGTAANVTLKWYGGRWAHLYDVYLGTTSSPPLIASNLALGPSESATEMQSYDVPSTLASGTTYYWKVVAKTMAMREKSSPLWTFTTGGTAGGVAGAIPVSPIGTASAANPTFVWTAVSNATHYELWLNDSTGNRFDRWFGASDVGCPSGGGSCSLAPLVPLRPGAIIWWVRTWSAAGGYGPWSSAVSFTLLALSTPRLISPSGTMPDWPTVHFRWQAVAGATHYYLWVNDGWGTTQVRTWYTAESAGCASASTCTITLRPTLNPGTATWWIQAWNATAGYSPWSAGMRALRP